MRRLDTTLLRHDKMNETSRSSGFSDRANLTGWSLKDLNREGARVYLGVIHNRCWTFLQLMKNCVLPNELEMWLCAKFCAYFTR